MTSTPAPGPHGGDVLAVARWLGCSADDVLDLSVSLNPVAPALDPAVEHLTGDLRHYPDDHEATDRLADAIEVPSARLVLTNGGSEAIALVAALEKAGSVEAPEFSLYERHLVHVDPGAPRWRSNPSNPEGRLAPADAEARVWDEAFWPLATGTWTRGDDDAWRVGSLTKLWACPGVRLGYLIAPDDQLADAARDLRPQWSVNALALATIAALLPTTDLCGWSSRTSELRAQLVDDLLERDLKVQGTDAAWVLVDSHGLRDRLIPKRVLVRDCTSFGMPGIFRIGVPGDDARQRLLDALDATAERP